MNTVTNKHGGHWHRQRPSLLTLSHHHPPRAPYLYSHSCTSFPFVFVVEEPGGSYRAISTGTVTVLDSWLLLLAGKKHSSSQERTRSDPDFNFFLEQDISSGGLDPDFEEASNAPTSVVDFWGRNPQRKPFAPSSPVREFFWESHWLVCDGSLRPPVCCEGGSETCCRVGGTPADHVGGLWSETRWLACDAFSKSSVSNVVRRKRCAGRVLVA
jgi:hypothetical protein